MEISARFDLLGLSWPAPTVRDLRSLVVYLACQGRCKPGLIPVGPTGPATIGFLPGTLDEDHAACNCQRPSGSWLPLRFRTDCCWEPGVGNSPLPWPPT